VLGCLPFVAIREALGKGAVMDLNIRVHPGGFTYLA